MIGANASSAQMRDLLRCAGDDRRSHHRPVSRAAAENARPTGDGFLDQVDRLDRRFLGDQPADERPFVERVPRRQVLHALDELLPSARSTTDECAYRRWTEMHAWPERRKPPSEQRSAT